MARTSPEWNQPTFLSNARYRTLDSIGLHGPWFWFKRYGEMWGGWGSPPSPPFPGFATDEIGLLACLHTGNDRAKEYSFFLFVCMSVIIMEKDVYLLG